MLNSCLFRVCWRHTPRLSCVVRTACNTSPTQRVTARQLHAVFIRGNMPSCWKGLPCASLHHCVQKHQPPPSMPDPDGPSTIGSSLCYLQRNVRADSAQCLAHAALPSRIIPVRFPRAEAAAHRGCAHDQMGTHHHTQAAALTGCAWL